MGRVSILMPVYNQEKLAGESIWSVLKQDYIDKEIVIIDDCSQDNTYEICNSFGTFVKLFKNDKNLGLAGNLNECVKKSTGEYIVILCGDDTFTHKSVISDMVKIFEDSPQVGVVGRYYYQYLDGYKGAVMVIRGNIFTSSCQPSGIGFRRSAIPCEFSNKILVEIPLMVKRIVDAGWDWKMMEYDTIAARLHFGKSGNAAIMSGYYKTTPQQSPTLNWLEVLNEPIGMYLGFIQMKNRARWLLLDEIKQTIKINPRCLLNIGFWFCVSVALLIPSFVLKHLSNWYRHRITRKFVRVIERRD